MRITSKPSWFQPALKRSCENPSHYIPGSSWKVQQTLRGSCAATVTVVNRVGLFLPGTTFGNKEKERGAAAITQMGLWHPLWEVTGPAALSQVSVGNTHVRLA